MKRVLCLTLCLLLVFGCFTPAAYAADIEPDTQVLAQPGDVQIEATNRIGSLLSAEITEVEQDSESSGLTAFVITDLTVDGNTAVVSYSAEDCATVVVALYSEDGLRMLTSASGEASPDASEITVTFSGEMPEYFLARAYMLAPDDCTPLSDVYETPIYTQSMQELLDSTIDDYDPELVVNFDDDPNTNFAVYNEGVVIVDEVEGVNIVTTNDDENLLYVIENADDTFTTLQEGDIVSYFYGEDQLLLCKVSSLTVDGTNVTIHGADDMMIEDVFSHFKLESDSDAGDFVVEDTNLDDGIAVGDPATASPAKVTSVNNQGNSVAFYIPIVIEEKEWESKDGNRKAKASGNIDITVKLTIDFYVSRKESYFREKFDYTFSVGFHADGEVEIPLVDFSRFSDNNIAIVGIVMNPEFVITISGKIDCTGQVIGTFGFNASTGRDPINLTTIPKMSIGAEMEFELYLGWDLGISAFVLKKDLVSATLSIPIGGTVKGSICGQIYEDAYVGSIPESIHECTACLKGTYYFNINIEIKFELLNNNDLSSKITIPLFKSNESKFYYSIDYKSGGYGDCPYNLFLVVFEALSKREGKNIYDPVSDVTIYAADLVLSTDEEGIARAFLPEGNTRIRVDYLDFDDTFLYSVKNYPQKYVVLLDDAQDSFVGIPSDDIEDGGVPVAFGNGWKLFSNGTLKITIQGEIGNYYLSSSTPWGKYASQITKVIVSDGCTRIGKYNFAKLPNLTEVYLGKDVQEIGERAFLDSENIKTVHLPEGLISIDSQAFYGCSSLERIILPNSLSTLGGNAFYGCNALSEVIIPSGLSTLDSGAFQRCEGLKSVIFDDDFCGVIYGYVFSDCTSLEKVIIPDGAVFPDNVSEQAHFMGCTGLRTVVLPENMTTIPYQFFSGCTSLRSVEIPETVTSIGSSAFENCSGLTYIEIPEGVTEIVRNAFTGCTSLTEVAIPSTVSVIEEEVFMDCVSLTHIELPYGITLIDEHTFEGCSSLSRVVIPDTVEKIEIYAFAECDSLKSIELPYGVKNIGMRAFATENGLNEINIPASVTYIGDKVFGDNPGAMTVIFEGDAPTNLSSNSIFGKAYGTVYYPAGRAKWTQELMNNCGPNMTWICYRIDDAGNIVPVEPEEGDRNGVVAIGSCGQNSSWILTVDGLLTINGSGYISSMQRDKQPWRDFNSFITEVYISPGIDYIGEFVFYNCYNLRSVYIPDSVEQIHWGAFMNCTSLTAVELPDGITSVPQELFASCTNLTHVSIPDSVNSIGSGAFRSCRKLTSMVIPELVTIIGNSVFAGCDSLTNVNIPSQVSQIGSYAFQSCSSLKNIIIPESVTSIGIAAFHGCDNLEDIQIPDSVTEIKESTFYECGKLKSIVLPDSIISIGKEAFMCCRSMSSIYIPNTVTNIGEYAFSLCDNLTDVYYSGTEEEWNGIIIGIVNDDLTGAIIHFNSSIPMGIQDEFIAPTLDATFGGAYNGEDMDDYIQRTASFSGLIPGAQYVMLSMVNIDTAEPVAPENLLYIDQAEAGEDGTLQFTYVQRVTTDPSYVVLCGPATKSIADADITVPDYYSDGELHVVNPTLIYDGDTLIEGRDYEISGQVCFDECGTYTCFIRGIHNYTGTLQCVYTVGEWNCSENGHEFEDGFCRYCGEEDPDYEPTDPTEPFDPTDPTDPTVPEDPTDPTEPSASDVIRLAGSNRYLTGFAVADQLKRNMGIERFDAVVVAYGQNFPDALTGSYLAAVKGAPILLTEPSADADLLDYLKNNLTSGGTVYILGGTAAVSQAFEDGAGSLGFAVKRLKGAGRYETNLAILREAGVNREDEVLIATGKNYADSLSASATGLPMLLVDAELTQAQKEFLESTSGKFVIIGGTGAVSGAVEAQLDAIGDVVRVKGANRYGTSVEIAKRYFTSPESVVLAYAQGFPDGLCGGPLALSMEAPLILTSNENAAVADDYVVGIQRGAVTGGTGRISDDTVRAIFDLNSDTPIVKP